MFHISWQFAYTHFQDWEQLQRDYAFLEAACLEPYQVSLLADGETESEVRDRQTLKDLVFQVCPTYGGPPQEWSIPRLSTMPCSTICPSSKALCLLVQDGARGCRSPRRTGPLGSVRVDPADAISSVKQGWCHDDPLQSASGLLCGVGT